MLSLSMVVRNEAERIAACLASVAGFVDEMVLLDTGSSDATVAIAEGCGAVVHHLSWPGDFAPARNHALSLVRGDWVLVLDADERLTDEARGPLQALMAEPDLLLINLLRQELGARQSPYSNVSRLFRRHPAIRWSRPYHSMVDDSVAALLRQEPHWRIADCPVVALLHDGYRPELLAASDKARRLRQAMEAELSRHPGDPYACAKLGGLELSEGHRERAITLLEQGLAQIDRAQGAHNAPEHYELLLHLAMAVAESDPARAITLYHQALALPLDQRLTVAACLNLAALLLSQGQLAEAASLTAAVTAAAPELALGWFNRGLIARQQGQLTEAISAYRQALALEPAHAEAQQNLAVALLLAGDITGARDGFRQAIALLQEQGRGSEAEALRQRASGLVKLDP
jgi:tetratricopeptide (TPR) repeat protein